MLYAVPIQCPKCRRWVEALGSAYKVGDIHFYVCVSCLGTITTLDDALRVGYNTGYARGLERAAEIIGNEKSKELP